MSAIDQRIVEMKFENHLFEKNAATSISTLQKLKEALNFGDSAKSIGEIETAVSKVDFSRIVDSLEAVSSRFSTFGIVGMTAIQNLTTAAMELGSRLASNILAPIKTGGWNRATNIDKAEFKIKGLKKDWDALQDDINYGVQDTAYGFDEAANVAAQLAASGVEAGDEMKKYLRGISGVAAMTGSTYSEIGHIFTTISGEGKLSTMRLNQFAVHGLNVASEMANQWGKTEAEVREMAHNGEISFKMFADAMDDAFGEHAKAANDTFEGAFANMKAALSRIGADFAAPIRKNMIPIFNELKQLFKDVKQAMVDNEIYKDFTDFLEHVSGIVAHIIKSVDLTWWRNFTASIHKAYQEFSSFMSKSVPLWDNFAKGAEKVEETIEEVKDTMENFGEVVDAVIAGKYGNGQERFDALVEKFGFFEQIQNLVNEKLGDPFRYDIPDAVEEATDAIKDGTKDVETIAKEGAKKSKKITKVVEEGEKDVEDIVKNGADAIKDYAEIVDDVISGKYGSGQERVDALKEKFGSFEKIQNLVNEKLGNPFRYDIPEAVDEATESVEEFDAVVDAIIRGEYGNGQDRFDALIEKFGQFEKYQNAVNERLGDDFRYDVPESIDTSTEAIETQQTATERLNSSYANLFNTIKDVAVGFATMFNAGEVEQLIGHAATFVRGLIDGFDILTNTVDAFIKGAAKPVIDIVKNFIILGTVAASTVGTLISRLHKFMTESKAFVKIEQVVNRIFTKIANVVAKLTGAGLNLFSKISSGSFGFLDIFEDVGKIGTNVFGSIGDIVKNLTAPIKQLQDTVTKAWIAFKDTKSYKRIKNIFSDIKETILDFKNKTIDKFINKLQELKEKKIELPEFDVETFVSKVDEKLNWLLDKLHNVKESIKNFPLFAKLKERFSDLLNIRSLDDLTNLFEKIKTDVIDSIKTILGEENFTEVTTDVTNFVKVLKEDVVKGLSDANTSISDILETIGEAIENFKVPTLGDIITKLFQGTAIYTVYNFVRAVNGILKSIWNWGGILQQIKGTIRSLKWHFYAEVLTSTGHAILEFAEAIGVLALAMKFLSGMTWDQFAVAAASIAVLTGALGALLWIATRNRGGTVYTPIQSLVSVLTTYKAMVQEFLRKVGAAATLTAFATAIGTIIKIMGTILDMKWSDAKKAILILGGVMLELVIAMKLLNGVHMNFGAAAVVVAVAFAVKLMATVVSELGSVPFNEALQGVVAMGAIVLLIKTLIRTANGLQGATLPIIGLALMIGAIAGALVGLSMVDPTKLVAAALSLTSIVGAMAALMAAIKFNGKLTLKDVGAIAVLMAAIAAIVAVITFLLKAMRGVDGDNAIKIALALDSLLVSIGLLMLSTNKLTKLSGGSPAKTVLNGIAIIGVITLWIGALAAILNLFGNLNKDGTFQDKLDKGMEIINRIAKMMKKLVLFIFIIGVTSKLLASPVGGPLASLGKAAGGVGSLAIWIAGIGAILAGLGELHKIWVDENGDSVLVDLMDNAAPVLSAAGYAIGSALHGFIGGLLGFAVNFEPTSLVEQIENMFTLIDKFSEYGKEGSKAIDVSGVEAIASFFLTFAKAELASGVAGFTSFFSGIFVGSKDDIDKMGEKLVAFAEQMVPYSQKMEGIKTDVIANTSAAIETVLAFAHNVPNEGGALGFWVGDNKLEAFSKGLPKFAKRMKKYSENIEGFKDDAVTKSSKAIETIIKFSRKVPNEGGLLALFITGDNRLEDFARNLEPFANAMVIYSRHISHFHTDAAEKTSGAIAAIIAFSQEVPNHGGLLGILAGENDINTFGTYLVEFAGYMVTYSNTIQDVKTDKSDAVIANLTSMMDIIERMPTTFNPDLVQRIEDTGDLIERTIGVLNTSFSENELVDVEYLQSLATVLGEYGNTLTTFWKSTKGIGKNFKSVAQAGIDTLKVLTQDKGIDSTYIYSIVVKKADIITYGETLHNLAKELKHISDKAYTGAKNARDITMELSDSFVMDTTFIDSVAAAKDNLIAFGQGLWGFAKEVKKFSDDSIVEKAGNMVDLVKKFDTEKLNVGSIIGNYFGTTKEDGGNAQNSIDVATKMIEFANLMVEFSNIIATIAVDETAENFGKLTDFLNSDSVQAMFDTGNTSSLSSVAQTLAGALVSGLTSDDIINQINGAGTAIVTELISGLSSGETDLNKQVDDLVGVVTDILTEASDVSGEPNTAATDFSSLIATTMKTILDENSDEIGASAEDIIGKVVTALDNGRPDATGSINATGKAMIDIANSYKGDFKTLGGDIMQGLANGMEANKNVPISTAGRILSQVLSASKKSVESKSPSKKFIELGENNMKGLAIGMKDNTDLVLKPAKAIGETLLDTYSTSMTKTESATESIMNTIAAAYLYINELVNEGIQQPVISPVLDLTNVRNGVGDISSLFGNSSLSPMLSSAYIPRNVNEYQVTGFDQREIVSAIRGIRTDIGALGQAISNMEIKMSTGQVVGAVTPGIDRSLGSIQKYNARWA